MTETIQPWTMRPFERWVMDEGLQVITQPFVQDIRTVGLKPWARTGCLAALVDLTDDPLEGSVVNHHGAIAYLCDIPPAGTFQAERHLYEEIFYVVRGRGATSVWVEGGDRHTFEWNEGSVFSIPLNAWHELYNGQGDETVRLYAATNAPGAINMYVNTDFIFNCPYVFADRFSGRDERYFSGEWHKLESRFTETNFIPDVRTVALDTWSQRGPGVNMMFSMAGGHFICHVSEFPVGTYKKAHSHHVQRERGGGGGGDAVYILIIKGSGYDLQWPAGEAPERGMKWKRHDWDEGTLITPGRGYHQHFNTSSTTSRYLVLRPGNPRYSGALGARYKTTGGEQIDFEDEDPEIRGLFIKELEKKGITPAMPAAHSAR